MLTSTPSSQWRFTRNENQQWISQGTGPVLQLHGTAEGHVPASQGLTKRGPLEKGMANHSSILALRTPWTIWKGKRYDTERWASQVCRCPVCYWGRAEKKLQKEWRGWAKVERMPSCAVSGGESQVRRCKEQYWMGTWNVRSVNQGTLDAVKKEVARVNIGVLGITELKWEWENLITMTIILTTVDKNPLEENGVVLTVNKRVWNAVLMCSFKNERMISVRLQGEPFSITVIEV